MRSSDWRGTAIVAALAALGFGLTQIIFYPGIMTYDAKYVYLYIKGGVGDWQSPVMTWLWSVIDPIAPGPGSMFLLSTSAYWLAFALIALLLLRRSLALAVLLMVLALTPPALALLGVIWRDVLLANIWLLAAALAFCAADSRKGQWALQAAALALIAFGVLLRPNAVLAAPVLAAYVLWPHAFRFKRSILVYIPAGLAMYALVPLIYYGALHAKRENPLHSIMVFDLGGISHFAKENQFPVTWSPQENALVTDGCYKPTLWDIYWTHEPCKFVMARLETEKVFGTPKLVAAWRDAILHHPVAYLEHRSAFMWTLLTGRNLAMWQHDIEDYTKPVFPGRPAFAAFRSIYDVLYPTPLFRAWPWLLLCIALTGLALRRRETAEGAFVIGVCGSAVFYVLTYFPVGVAPDYRYVYWAVLAGLSGLAVLPARSAPA